MPAFVKRSVGSPWGITGADGTISWPRALKKSRKLWRISRDFMAVAHAFPLPCEAGEGRGGGRFSHEAGGLSRQREARRLDVLRMTRAVETAFVENEAIDR